jgi:hypothetical protein
MSASIPTAHTIGAAIRHQTARQIAECGACGVEIETPAGPVLVVTPTERPLCADCGTEFAPALQRLVEFAQGDIWPRVQAERPSLGEWLEVFAILETLRSGYRRTA